MQSDMDSDKKEADGKNTIKTMGRKAWNIIIETLSENSSKDLIESIIENIDMISPDEQNALYKVLHNRANNGIRSLNNSYHYLIINTTHIKSIMSTEYIRYMYLNSDSYLGDSNNMQLLFVRCNSNDPDKTTDNFKYSDMAILDPDNNFTFHKGRDADIMFDILKAKNPITRPSTQELCIKLDPTGVIDVLTNTDKLVHTPMNIEFFGYIGDLIGECAYDESPDLVEDLELRRIRLQEPYSIFEFDILVDNQPKRVLYYDFAGPSDSGNQFH